MVTEKNTCFYMVKKIILLATTIMAVVAVCAFAHDEQHHNCSVYNHPEKYVCKRCDGRGTDPVTFCCSSCEGKRYITRSKKCSSCGGTGRIIDRYGDRITCSSCNGTGRHIIDKQLCPKCSGSGKEKRPCLICQGTGYVERYN